MRGTIESLEGRRLVATVPAGFAESTAVSGIYQPTSLVTLPDGRMLVSQRTGDLRVVKAGQLLPTPALHLNVDGLGERGLLGVEADPNFATNHYVYLHYVLADRGYAQVSRYVMNGDTISPASELRLLKIDPVKNAPYHFGGAIHFGTDGKLYIGIGDNQNGADAQSLATTHGKILRINSNGSIPSDNPYYNTLTGGLRSIYATGFRNPFTFGVNKVSGAIYVNDVGENTYEEIDALRKGANYGWPATEGPTTAPGVDAPIYAYKHPDASTRESITGGAFYAGVTQQFPAAYAGKYFFGDYVQGFIQTLDPVTKTATPFAEGLSGIVDLDVAADGTLLCTTYDGFVHAFKYTGNVTPPPTGTASINAYVINDTNGDGKWGSGEKGVAGRTVWLDLNADGLLNGDEPTLLTGANGNFKFTGLAAGTYRVREILPAGWRQTSPAANGSLFMTLATGQASSGKSFQTTNA